MPITEEGILERIQRKDEPVFEPFGHPISFNKIHAIQYGIGMGIVAGILASFRPIEAMALSMALFLLSFGLNDAACARIGARLDTKRSTIFVATIQHKPHYFILPYLPAMLLGWIAASILL